MKTCELMVKERRGSQLSKSVLVLLCAVLGFAACAETGLKKDISYAEPAKCQLDIQWPLGVTGFSTVVWFHGGGLVGGKRHFIRIDESIAQVAVSYRFLEKWVPHLQQGCRTSNCL